LNTGLIHVCDLNSQTNLLSNCVTSTLGQSSRSFTGVVVSGSDAWVTNEAASPCSLVYCSNAVAMSGCSCVASTSGISLSQAKGISLSPAKDKIYVQGMVSSPTEGIVACNIVNSALSGCTTYSLTNTGLTGMYATDTKLYTYDDTTAGAVTTQILVCDATNPTSCTLSSASIGSGLGGLGLIGLTRSGPWGLSVFDGNAYVPDNDKVLVCSNVSNISGCNSQSLLTMLNKLLTTAGATSIFIYPRV
jgi:hypothetical protein